MLPPTQPLTCAPSGRYSHSSTELLSLFLPVRHHLKPSVAETMPQRGLHPLLHTVRIVMRNGASFTMRTTMRRTTPYMLQHVSSWLFGGSWPPALQGCNAVSGTLQEAVELYHETQARSTEPQLPPAPPPPPSLLLLLSLRHHSFACCRTQPPTRSTQANRRACRWKMSACRRAFPFLPTPLGPACCLPCGGAEVGAGSALHIRPTGSSPTDSADSCALSYARICPPLVLLLNSMRWLPLAVPFLQKLMSKFGGFLREGQDEAAAGGSGAAAAAKAAPAAAAAKGKKGKKK